jgi:hypothetical protein
VTRTSTRFLHLLRPHRQPRLGASSPTATNALNDTRRERLEIITRILFPSHEIAAIEWLSNIRALHSLAAGRFDGNTAEALRWLAPALAELTPHTLLFAIRTRMPLEVTAVTTHLADRITALAAYFFPGSSEYHAYLWLNDVAKLAELARLVREGDLPATFVWVAPAIELAAELRSMAQHPRASIPEPEEQPLEAWKGEICAWLHDCKARQLINDLESPPHPLVYQGPGMYSAPGIPQPQVETPEMGLVYEIPPMSTLSVPVRQSELLLALTDAIYRRPLRFRN